MSDSYPIVPRLTKYDLTARSSQSSAPSTTLEQADIPAAAQGWFSEGYPLPIQAAAVETSSGRNWLAGWGGVLRWSVEPNVAVHYTSAHGLPGNAMRAIAVDESGTVWAAGYEKGLAYLRPGANSWLLHQDLMNWQVKRLVALPGGGVAAALYNYTGDAALGILRQPSQPLELHISNHPVLSTLHTLLAAAGGTIWLCGLHGLFRYEIAAQTGAPWPSVERLLVQALAPSDDGVWLGALQGLFRIRQHQQIEAVTGAPGVEVVALLPDAEDRLWLATPTEVGYHLNGQWTSVADIPHRALALFPGEGKWEIIAVGREGVYGVCEGHTTPLLNLPEGLLGSNAIQDLAISRDDLWAATPRGLYRRDTVSGWQLQPLAELDHASVSSVLEVEGAVLAASWQGGSHYIESGQAIPDRYQEPLVALGGVGDHSWAASPSTLFQRHGMMTDWKPVWKPGTNPLGAARIQVLLVEDGAAPAGASWTVWLGTSEGLFFHTDGAPQPMPAPNAGACSINGLVRDPYKPLVWAATSNGLLCVSTGNVIGEGRELTALLVDPRPDGGLWIGTRHGLELWPRLDATFDMSAARSFRPLTSGMAASHVTALVWKHGPSHHELWVGTTAGLSRYFVA